MSGTAVSPESAASVTSDFSVAIFVDFLILAVQMFPPHLHPCWAASILLQISFAWLSFHQRMVPKYLPPGLIVSASDSSFLAVEWSVMNSLYELEGG